MSKTNDIGRPRKNPPRRSKFGDWLDDSKFSPMEAKDELGCGLSTIYAISNGEFVPGRRLGFAIAKLTKGKIPYNDKSWPKGGE